MSEYSFKLRPVGNKVKPKPRLVLYGDPGYGKTTFALSAGKVLYIPTEAGSEGINPDHYPEAMNPLPKSKVGDWDELVALLDWVLETDLDVNWLAIDTLDAAEAMCRETVCRNQFRGDWQTFGAYGVGEGATHEEFKKLTLALDRIRDAKGIGIILISHTGMLRSTNGMGADFMKFAGNLHKRNWEEIREWSDQVGHAAYDIQTFKLQGESKTKARISDSTRYVWFQGDAGRDCKCRKGYELPEKIEFTWDAYYNANMNNIKGGSK